MPTLARLSASIGEHGTQTVLKNDSEVSVKPVAIQQKDFHGSNHHLQLADILVIEK